MGKLQIATIGILAEAYANINSGELFRPNVEQIEIASTKILNLITLLCDNRMQKIESLYEKIEEYGDQLFEESK